MTEPDEPRMMVCSEWERCPCAGKRRENQHCGGHDRTHECPRECMIKGVARGIVCREATDEESVYFKMTEQE